MRKQFRNEIAGRNEMKKNTKAKGRQFGQASGAITDSAVHKIDDGR